MLRQASLKIIRFYQEYIRVFTPSSCRFSPTCSEYAREAIGRYGFFKGGSKAIRRIFSCHPFSGRSGYNPVD